MNQSMGTAEFAAAAPSRLNREDHDRTKHDSHFSKWKVLIGPNDWEDHSLGKEGVARYRFENLPKSSGPGLYELGVAVAGTGLGRDGAKLDQDRTVVVYLGEADSVRTRLQQYGRSGAHLGRSGTGYFEDIFCRGYSIVYRWASMENKANAERTESQLLHTFDYAWNKGSNGARRPLDVLQKVDKVASGASRLSHYARRFLPSQKKRVGIRIDSNKPSLVENEIRTYAESESHNFLQQVLKFTRSQPRLVSDRLDATENHKTICGVDLNEGSICGRPPVDGRKRCPEHKGMRIKGSVVQSNITAKSQLRYDGSEYICPGDRDFNVNRVEKNFGPFELPSVTVKGSLPICGVALANGSPCRMHPIRGRNRCEAHKGQRISSNSNLAIELKGKPRYNHDSVANGSQICVPRKVENHADSHSSVIDNHWDTICGVELGSGYVCTNRPVRGRVRCEEHRGLRVNGLLSKLSAKSQTHVPYIAESTSYNNWSHASSSVCGAATRNGSSCRRPVKGHGRCWQHQ